MTNRHSIISFGIVFFIVLTLHISSTAQALLPNISAYSKNGKTYVTWTSGYAGIKQIGVQRSTDSLYNYATIGYVSNPNKKINEYIDTKGYPGKNFYRLFILFTNNSYFYSNPATVSLEPSTLTSDNASQAYQPSVYVYTNPDGNVNISLAHAPQKHYDINFYNSSNRMIFSLHDIQKPFLILDKSNFLQSGWYRFELFEDGKIKEKWKFYIGAE